MATDELIAALQGTGRVDAEGSFGFDREKAREKLRTFQVAEPQRYVLHLVALATLKGASQLEIECDSDDLIARFDGAPLTAEDLDDLYNSSFAAAPTDLQRARQQLAIGLHAALALNPRHVRVTSGTLTMLARHGAADLLGAAKVATAGTQIHVKQRFRPGLLVRFVKHLRGTLAEAAWVRERGCYAELPITVNGERVNEGLVLGGVEQMQRGEAGDCRGVAGLLPDGYEAGAGGVIRLVRHGVWICDERRAWLPDGLVVVVANDRLRTDLSGDKVVQDEEHARAVALGVALAGQVVARAIGEGAEVELEEGLWQRLRAVWREWPGALDPQTAIGEALARVLLVTDLWGRRCTLGRLREEVSRVGHLAVSSTDFAGLLPAREALVIRKGDVFIDSLLATIFADRCQDVTAELEHGAAAEIRRRRWRAQPGEPRLNAGNYLLTVPLKGKLGGIAVVGEVGLRRAPSEGCTLRVIVHGHVLTELELTAPIAGVDAVIGAPLAIADDFSGPVRDEHFAEVLAVWLAAAREIVAHALQAGLLTWAPGPEREALLYGLLRAQRGEGLRATLQDAGFTGEALTQHERALAGLVPPTPFQIDLPERAWMREAFQFATAGGLTLSVGAVAAGLRKGLPLAWVPESYDPHEGIVALVLLVDVRGQSLLRWLFPGQVRRMTEEEYAHLRGEARLRARPAERFEVPTATHLAGVVTVREGLRVALGFARTLVDWEATPSCTIFHSGRTLTRVRLWSPVAGVGYAIAGESLTVRPGWDAVVPDDAYVVALRRAAAAVPVLVRQAIVEVGRFQVDAEARASWRRGVLAALAATFPTVALRDAYAWLVARHGAARATGPYEVLLALAQQVPLAQLDAELSRRCAEASGLDDVRELAVALSVPPPTPEQVEAVAGVLRELRELLGQTGGETLLDDVLRCARAVGELPLFERVDGASVTLAEALALGGGLHIFMSADTSWPGAYGRSLRVDRVTSTLLERLVGPGRLRTDPIVDAEPEPVRVATRRAPERTAVSLEPELEEPAPPTMAELHALFAELETEARERQVAPVVAEVEMRAAPQRPAPPNPAERLIGAVRAELDALRRGHEALLTGFNLDHVQAAPGGDAAVSVAASGLRVHVGDPQVQRAIAGHAGDPALVSFLASRVYTALNVWREDITDVDEQLFHARHLAWLASAG
jgi:hypothetical protein